MRNRSCRTRVVLNNADDADNAEDVNYAAAGKDQRPVRPLPPTTARCVYIPPHPKSSTCYLVRVVLRGAQLRRSLTISSRQL